MTPVSYTQTGFDGTLTREQYRQRLTDAIHSKQASAWAIGDAALLADGNADFDEEFIQVASAELISERSVANYKSISRRFPAPKRLFAVSHSHYATVAALDDESAFDLLHEAQMYQMSREIFRKRVREYVGAQADDEPVVCKATVLDAMSLRLDTDVSAQGFGVGEVVIVRLRHSRVEV